MNPIVARLYGRVSEVVDEVAMVLSVVGRRHRAFARSVDPPPLHTDLIELMEASPPVLRWPTRLDRPERVEVRLPALGLTSFLDFHPARSGRADTLWVYHHGLGEIPHDALARALHRARPLAERCDLICLKAPFHDSGARVAERFLACRTGFARYLAGQVATAKQVARTLGDRYRFLALSGVSMGGIIALGESAYDSDFDLTVPVVAGPCLYDVLLESSFRRNVAPGFLRAEQKAPWRRILDLDDRLRAGSDGPPIRPLLARNDRLFRLDAQMRGFAGCARARVTVCEGGHITGAANIVRHARHLVSTFRAEMWEAELPLWRERGGRHEVAAAHRAAIDGGRGAPAREHAREREPALAGVA
jgi:hypothetical protein